MGSGLEAGDGAAELIQAALRVEEAAHSWLARDRRFENLVSGAAGPAPPSEDLAQSHHLADGEIGIPPGKDKNRSVTMAAYDGWIRSQHTNVVLGI